MKYYKIKIISENKLWYNNKLYRHSEDNQLEFYLSGRWVESTHRTITSVLYSSRFLKPELVECTEEDIIKELTMRELEK